MKTRGLGWLLAVVLLAGMGGMTERRAWAAEPAAAPEAGGLETGWGTVTRAVSGRSDPDAGAQTVREFREGETVRVLASFGSFRLVRADDGTLAFLESRALRQLEGKPLTVADLRVDQAGAKPEVCIVFSDRLRPMRSREARDYLRLDPPADFGARIHDRNLCLSGLDYGTRYTATLKAGLPGEADLRLPKDRRIAIETGDREARIALDPRKYVLPVGVSKGVPVRTVNLAEVHARLYWIAPRMLSPIHRRFTREMTNGDLAEIAEYDGTLLWEGGLAVERRPNAEVTTLLDFSDIEGIDAPGVYVVAAGNPEEETYYWQDVATQWFLRSDIGLSTYAGSDGLHVVARALGSAAPLPGLRLTLLARNNEVLGEATTDERGIARFAAGLLRGQGGNTPAVLMAETAAGDFNFLVVDKSRLDISDRDIDGRPTPGPVDAFLYTERGVYRPEEAVNLYAMVRDRRTDALPGVPLTLEIARPDGETVLKQAVTTDEAGGVHIVWPLTRNAVHGAYSARLLAGSETEVGSAGFLVEDYVPATIAVAADSDAGMVTPGDAVPVRVGADYLAGGPAAGLTVIAEATVRRGRARFEAMPDFVFGLQDVEVAATRLPQVTAETGPDGAAAFDFALAEEATAGIAAPLDLAVSVSVLDVGGRANRAELVLPIANAETYIGIRPLFENGGVASGETAKFEVRPVDSAGRPKRLPGLRYEIAQEWDEYEWYQENGEWHHTRLRNSRPIRSGALEDLLSGGVAILDLPPAEYRFEVFDETSGAATSYHFAVGWESAATAADVPDRLGVTLGAGPAEPGSSRSVTVTAPFAGSGMLAVASDGIIEMMPFAAAAGANRIEIAPTADWGPGVHLLATVVRPMGTGEDYLPRRAVGLAWLPVAEADRTLSLTLSAPDTIRPDQRFEVEIRAAAAPQGLPKGVRVALAVVDEGLLGLTGYASPDPVRYFQGRRRLGIDLGDGYGKLIEGRDGTVLRVRSGGDMGALPEPGDFFKTLVIATAPKPLDAEGVARFAFDLPDFEGKARIMAVAYGRHGVGSAAGEVTVRYPVSADAYLPRFVALGDSAEATIRAVNRTDGPVEARLEATAGGRTGGSQAVSRVLKLAAGESAAVPLALVPEDLTPIPVTLTLDGAGESIEKHYTVSVRPAQFPIERRMTVALKPQGARPGTGRLTFDERLIEGFLARDVRIEVNVSSTPTLDVAGLLDSLARYPYGCVEQTASSTIALAYYNMLAARVGAPGIEDADERVAKGIARLLDMQRYDGSFGFWSSLQSTEPWLTVYATDILLRLRAAGHAVPDFRLEKALDWVADSRDGHGASVHSYANYVLAKAARGKPGEFRYFADTFRDEVESTYLAAQQAVFFARAGDGVRFERLVASLDRRLDRQHPGDEFRHEDYGSGLRDLAQTVTMLSEAGVEPKILERSVDAMLEEYDDRRYASTQEQAWLVMAAAAVMHPDAPYDLSFDGERVTGKGVHRFSLSPGRLATGATLQNQGNSDLYVTARVAGSPAYDLGAEGDGLEISKQVLSLDGTAVDPQSLRQGDSVLVIVEGKALDDRPAHQLLVTDLLPAGLEIENPNLAGSQTVADLGLDLDLSPAKHIEARDDRFVAAIDLEANGARDFRFAYIARATTTGRYKLPGAFVEDMYQPRYQARSPVGEMLVGARQ